jgi:hypothetical protein
MGPGSNQVGSERRIEAILLWAALVWLVLGSLAVGTYLAGVMRDTVHTAQASYWPTARGALLSARIVEQKDGDSAGYAVRVRYRYTVRGARYVGSVWSPTEEGARVAVRRRLELRLRRIRDGAWVRVYYNPANPREAVLFPYLEGKLFLHLFWGWGALFLLVPVIGGRMLAAWRDECVQAQYVPSAPYLPLPGSWRRFGIEDEGRWLRFGLSRRHGLSMLTAFSGALLAAGPVGFYLELAPAHPLLKWVAVLGCLLVALRIRAWVAPAGYLRFDSRRERITRSRAGKERLLAPISDVETVRISRTEQCQGSRNVTHDATIKLLRSSPKNEAPGEADTLLTLDVLGLPKPVAAALAQRLAYLVRAELVVRLQEVTVDGSLSGSLVQAETLSNVDCGFRTAE